LARQRLAEERLAGERRSAAFWRRQAEAAEEEAGVLQTRAAVAEVQRAAMSHDLESERRNKVDQISTMKQRFAMAEVHQREALESALERNRALEIELSRTRIDLQGKSEESKALQDTLSEVTSAPVVDNRNGVGKRLFRKKKSGAETTTTPSDRIATTSLLAGDLHSSSSPRKSDIKHVAVVDSLSSERVLRLSAEAMHMRNQYELLKRVTADELGSLTEASKQWANTAKNMIMASQSEIKRLRNQLSLESATRRKLLSEVQDLRGSVRVYCRARPPSSKGAKIISVPSHDTVLVHRERVVSTVESGYASTSPMSFEFDKVFEPSCSQSELYSEVEELVMGVLDGYNVCLLGYGQTGSGKTHTMFGNYEILGENEAPRVRIESHGMFLQSMEQLFNVIEHRSDRFQDMFSLTVTEVRKENRLYDLLAGTDVAEMCGHIQVEGKKPNRKRNEDDGMASQHGNSNSSRGSRHTKLEIRTNNDGDTVVQGLISVPIKTFSDVLQVWEDCLQNRAAKLSEMGINYAETEVTSSVIATMMVTSTNIATGISTTSRLQCVDLVGADLVPRKSSSKSSKSTPSDGMFSGVGNNNEWRFADKSLSVLSDVVNARCQFMRSVPYGNSTLTHLLRDSLEADTKVLMVVCVSSDAKDLQETACALRFASRMRRVNVGKATRHTTSLA